MVASSGRAEVKFQSSSAGAPLLVCWVAAKACSCGGGGLAEAKLKIDAEGGVAGT